MNANKKPLELQADIERMELELTKWNARRSLTPTERQVEAIELGGCVLLRDRTDPHSMYYNRIKGFGAGDVPRLQEILARYPDSEAAPCFDMTPDRMGPEASRALADAGFLPAEQLAFLAAEPSEAAEEGGAVTASPFDIRLVTERAAETFIRWIEASSPGQSIADATIERTKGYFRQPHFRNYMIEIDGRPAAMASLFLHGAEAYLANDYTFDAYRGRGCQTALIRRRLADAARLGAKAVYTDVVFGTPSHANMEKAGFRTAFVNTFWCKGL
ncbi:GNAT family N-acetyltransferase [Paenibacillus antri]|uniref:GNAT family N-acetyltransferase n=1 Tax=Paenibacillus antri TaxID=2582848 RepID=A0A5R9GAK3_9BACL|nr:GNAT family N-acetyltransferase [Paenibacillus antri]TLS49763.1 GNAT family N-acetyltransferase [Paenibacillus antri]